MCSGHLLCAALLVCLSNVPPASQQYALTYQQQLQQRYLQQQLLARGVPLNRYPYGNPQLGAVNPNYLALLAQSQLVVTPAPGPDPLLASCPCATPICQHPISNNRTYCQSVCIAEIGSCVVRCTSCSQAEGPARGGLYRSSRLDFDDAKEEEVEE